MNKLLCAGFARMWKARIFWLGILVLAALGLYMPISQYIEHVTYFAAEGYEKPLLSNGLFAGTVFVAFAAPVFVSWFLGTEYQDGTIRNKLVVGHSRSAIYLSNLVLSVTGSVLMHLAFLAAYCATGIPLLGPSGIDAGTLVSLLIGSTGAVCALAAIFTLAAMLCRNRGAGAIVCLLLAFALLLAAVYINSRLSEPEIQEYYYLNTETKETEFVSERNANYVAEPARSVYTFFQEFLPTGQVFLYAGLYATQTADQPWRLLAYALIFTAIITAAGLVCFRRKEFQ